MKKICLLYLAGTLALGASENMTVSRNGDDILLKSPFPGGYTLHRNFSARGPNKQFNFSSAALNKKDMKPIVVKRSGDDATPWNLNGT